MIYTKGTYDLVATKKKFWNRLKWFKRKNKVIEDSVLPVSDYIQTTDSLRSRSTSELSIEEPPRKRNGSSMYPGLSVSHDSVFHSPHSGSETDLDVAHSSSSLSIPTQPHADLQTELSERLRLRRSGVGRGDTSEDDEGLPHSPCNSPTTTDNLDKTALKDLPNKSHSTCSDGSLLSVGSSDIEEDLLISQLRHPPKHSLSENQNEFELNTPSIPLNHSAAHHRVSVKPKKTHGVPRRKRGQQLPNTLPTTIEVNEDSSIRSASPETNSKVAPTDSKLNRSKSSAGSKSQDALEEHTEKEEKGDKSFFERLFPRRSAKKKKAKQDEKKHEEKKIKLEEQPVRQDDKRDTKGGDAFKPNTEKYSVREMSYTHAKQTESSYRRYESKPLPAVRSGAAYRQRVLPIDIPDSPESFRKDEEDGGAKSQLPDILSTSPLHLELENKLKQRLNRSSPPPNSDTPDVPRQSTESISEEQCEIQKSPTPRYFENGKLEDVRPKIKLAGLSSLQQKVLALNEDEADYHNFKSLTEFPTTPPTSSVLLTKSHSFKSTKSTSVHGTSTTTTFFLNKNDNSKETSLNKSSSLDSVKVLEENDKLTENTERTSTTVQYLNEKIEHQRQVKQQTIDIKCDITVNDGDDLEEVSKRIMEIKSLCDIYPDKNRITISGPSHTAVVNVKNESNIYKINSEETQTKIETPDRENPKEHLISITKINVNLDNKESSPDSPVILETKPLFTSSKSPKNISDQARTRPIFNFETDMKQSCIPRKFSKDDVEVVDKETSKEIIESPKLSPTVTSSSVSPLTSHFKKNEKTTPKKSSVISITPESPTRDKSMTFYKSSSLDSLISDNLDSTDKSSQDSLDNIIEKPRDKPEVVVLRKKSSVKESKDEEPELMKVFARRSLKLKDSENESLSQQLSVMINENCDKARDSDKENQTDSPVKERRKSGFKESIKSEGINRKVDTEGQPRKKSITKLCEDENQNKLNEIDNKETNGIRKKPLAFELEKKEKEPLIESNVAHSKPIPIRRSSNSEDSSIDNEVALRKSSMDISPRSVSLNSPKGIDSSQNILRKQFLNRRRTDNWITNMKNEEDEKDKDVAKEDDSPKEETTELIIERKNFSQRKAEWEKRAQEAQKKSTP